MKKNGRCWILIMAILLSVTAFAKADTDTVVNVNSGIDGLLVLDVKPASYFTERGGNNQHGGSGLFARDEEIMGWLFSQSRGQNGK